MIEFEAESGAQLIARLTSQLRPQIDKLDKKIFPNDGPHQGEIAEISGEPNVGKTTLLMHIMARVILPTRYNGKDGKVLFLSTDNNFDFIKFMEILDKLIRESDTTTMDESTKILDVVKESLVNLTIVRCFNWLQFEIGILGLDRLFANNNRYCLVAVDSISAFYWEVSDTKKIRMGTHVKNVLKKFQRIVDDHHMVLVYTKPHSVSKQCSNAVSLGIHYVMELIDENGSDDESEISKFTYKMHMPSTKQTYFSNYNFESQGISWEK